MKSLDEVEISGAEEAPLLDRDTVLQPSSLRAYEWPAETPLAVAQPARFREASDDRLVREAARTVQFDFDVFMENTKHHTLPERIHFLLTHRAFQFNKVTEVRAEPTWLTRITDAVDAGLPIRIVYPLFCKIGNWAKQMTNVGPTAGDLCSIDFFAYINELVQRLYEPGLHFAIATDAQLYNSALWNPEVEVRYYIATLQNWIAQRGYDSFITLFNYVDLLAGEACEFRLLHHTYQKQICLDREKALGGINAKTLFESVKASINTRKFDMEYDDMREIFSKSRNIENRHYRTIEQMSTIAFEELVCIRFACTELNVFERAWPDHVRVTCHKGKKYGLAVIGLRTYPEYYGRSKLLPYHGVPLITIEDRVRMTIEPEVMLRGRSDLSRIHTREGDTFFYLQDLST